MLVYKMLVLFHSHFISAKLPSQSLHTSKGDRRGPGLAWSGTMEHTHTTSDGAGGDSVREDSLSTGSQEMNT